jgi:hypothetical protein
LSEESIGTLPPLGPIEGHKWFFPDFFQPMRVSAEPVCIYLFTQNQFLPPCILDLPFMSYRLRKANQCRKIFLQVNF